MGPKKQRTLTFTPPEIEKNNNSSNISTSSSSNSQTNTVEDDPQDPAIRDTSKYITLNINDQYVTSGGRSKPKFITLKAGWEIVKIAGKKYYRNISENRLIDPTIGYERTIYQGQIQDGIPHGKGIWHYPNNTFYIGQFLNGKRSNEGKIIRKTNGVEEIEFEGTWKNDRPWDGKGQFIHKDSSIFVGTFVNGNRKQGTYYTANAIEHGVWGNNYLKEGFEIKWIKPPTNYSNYTFSINHNIKLPEWLAPELKEQLLNSQHHCIREGSWRSKRVPLKDSHKTSEWLFTGNAANIRLFDRFHPEQQYFTGEIKDNLMIQGRLNFTSEGSCYEGEFQNNQPHGYGVFTHSSNTVWEGYFENGLQLTRGKVTFKDGEIQEGTFQNNHLNGQGKIITPDGEIQEGIFENYLLMQGKIITPDGKILEGIFENDLLKQGRITHPNGDILEGTFENDRLNGQGKIITPDGNILEGIFENNRLNGQGKITHPNGDILKGTFENNCLNGQGKVTLSNGDILEGTFENNRLNGQGKVTNPNGIIAEGYFKNNQLRQGKITFPNGSVYEGTFENNRLNGQGKVTQSNGSIQEGTFENNQLMQGKFTHPNGDILEGIFVNNRLNGQGKVTHPNGIIAEGYFKNSQLRQGKITFPSGNVYEGTFENNLLNGQGKVTLSNGSIQEGTFENNQLMQGKFTQPNGIIAEGYFKNSQLMQGKITFSSGYVYEGTFENNELRQGKITYPGGNVYEGTFENNELRQGKITYPSGIVSEGTFENNELRQGKITYPSGIVSEGTFENNKLRQGKITYPSGNVYEGTLKNQRFHGEGTYTTPQGHVWTGYFEDNQPISGSGQYKNKDGTIFDGTFTDAFKNGTGSIIYENHTLEGTFKDGKLEGLCEVSYKNGDRFKANFINGVMHGTGTLTNKDGLINRYDDTNNLYECQTQIYIDEHGTIRAGQLDNLQLVGQGTKRYSSGAIEEGIFINDLLNGKGHKKYADGLTRNGTFVNGRLHGEGIVIDPKKGTVEGTFINDELNGKGKQTYNDGTIKEGIFKNGRLHGLGKEQNPQNRTKEGNFCYGFLHGEGSLTKETDEKTTRLKGNFNFDKLSGFVEKIVRSKIDNSEKITFRYYWHGRKTNFIMDSLNRSTCKIYFVDQTTKKRCEINSISDLNLKNNKFINLENLRQKPKPYPIPEACETHVSKVQFLTTAQKLILGQEGEAQATDGKLTKWTNIATHLNWVFDELLDENNVKKLPNDSTCELIITYLTAIEKLLADESINIELKYDQIIEIASAKTKRVTCRPGFLAKLARIYQKLIGYQEGYIEAVLNAIHSAKDQFLNAYVNHLIDQKLIGSDAHVHGVSALIYLYGDELGMNKNLGTVDDSYDQYTERLNNDLENFRLKNAILSYFTNADKLIENVHFFIHENATETNIPCYLDEFRNAISEFLKQYKEFQKPENKIALADDTHILSNHFKEACAYSKLPIGSLTEEQYERGYNYALHDYIVDTYFEVAPGDDLKSPIGIKKAGIEVILRSMGMIESLPTELMEILKARESGLNQTNFTISSQ
jgi:hypothetical protein